MDKLYTLAYPTLGKCDAAFIERFRREHDLPYRDVVAPHSTMVFACSALPEAEYLQHVEAVAKASSAIDFSCRYAMLGSDDEDETAYVFLVPDEGYSGLSLLHDRLYTGPLSQYLWLDLPCIPHITIGTLTERHAAKQLCDDLNRSGLAIQGSVSSLAVGALANGKINNLASFKLRT